MQKMSRRSFVRKSSSLVAAASLSTGIIHPLFSAKNKIPLGLQLYSVRKDCEKDLPKTIETVARIGYKGVEFAGFYNYEAKEIKKLLDDNGLKCCGSHTQLNTLMEDELEKTIEFNSIIGNKYLIVPWLPEEKRTTKDDWKKLAEMFNELSEKVKTHGMLVGYHNHDFEFKELEGELPWDVFAQNTSKDVILQLDLGNCMSGGGDALAMLKKYPGRAVTIHLKEFSQTNKDAIIGEGDVDWKEVLKFCEKKGGTEWYIIEEEKDIYPPLEAVEKCYNNFQKL